MGLAVLNPRSQWTQTVAFPALPAVVLPRAPLVLSATASSGLPVQFTVVSGPGNLAGNFSSRQGRTVLVTLSAPDGSRFLRVRLD